MEILLFFVAHWYLSLFTQTFFHHRYSAHKMFTMNKFWEKFFYFLSFIFQGSSYLSPYAYGVLHRMHHAYADTEKDPHSPKYDGNLFKMMWKTKIIYNQIFRGEVEIEERFRKDVPHWLTVDKIGDYWPMRIVWGLFYSFYYIYFVPTGSEWMYLLLPIHYFMGPFHGAIINWFAHRIGYTNFKVSDTSKNLLPFDFLMLGESYHNNHHKYGGRANFGGIRWHEIDPVYPVIWFFDLIGIVKLKKQPGKSLAG